MVESFTCTMIYVRKYGAEAQRQSDNRLVWSLQIFLLLDWTLKHKDRKQRSWQERG